MNVRLALGCLLLLAGCATAFEIKEVPTPAESAATERVDGIVVNRQTTYKVTATSNFVGGSDAKLASKAALRGIDETRMLSLNICRYPFASGKLTTTLGATQAIEKFGVTSATGAARLLEAATEASETKKALDTPKPTPAPE